jgi:hypothetical protein
MVPAHLLPGERPSDRVLQVRNGPVVAAMPPAGRAVQKRRPKPEVPL